MKIVVGAKAAPALMEREMLVKEAERLLDLQKATLLYLIDVSVATVDAAMRARVKGQPYILDLGDDTYALAVAAEMGRLRARSRAGIAALTMQGATGIVYRGWFHRLILLAQRVDKPLMWVPDTVSDCELEARTDRVPEQDLICSFGSITNAQRRELWPPFYGGELFDLLEMDKGLRGLLVARGPGAPIAATLATERGLKGRIKILPELPQRALLEEVEAAAFVTSYQTDDVVGWSRTTGKLPLVLAAGRGLLTTNVGEAVRCLPARQRYPADREAYLEGSVRRIGEGWSRADIAGAKKTAERFRRSTQARRLALWLEGVLP